MEEVRKRCVAGIWAGWNGRGEFRRGVRRRARCREEEEEETGEGKGFGSGFIEAHCFVEERERRSGHGIGLRMAGGTGVPLGCVAAARHRRPDVAERGTASGGSAGGGRSGGATRGRGKGDADLQQLGKRPAAVGHARAAEAGEIGDSRKTMEDPKAKSRKARGPTIMHK
jgi:hypothetical protein